MAPALEPEPELVKQTATEPVKHGVGTSNNLQNGIGNDPYPSPVIPFFGFLGGPRRHRWIRLDILVRTHPGRGLGSSGIGTFGSP
eukprot:8387681-Pyramimonas_sp.AAC.1